MNHIATGRALSLGENYSLLIMGDSSGDEDGGGVDGDGFRGKFPVPAACRNRDFCPPNLTSRWRRLRNFSRIVAYSSRVFATESLSRRKGSLGGVLVGPHNRGGAPHPLVVPPWRVGPPWLPSGLSPVFWKLRGKKRYWALISSNSENISLLGFLKPKTAENSNWLFGISSIC